MLIYRLSTQRWHSPRALRRYNNNNIIERKRTWVFTHLYRSVNLTMNIKSWNTQIKLKNFFLKLNITQINYFYAINKNLIAFITRLYYLQFLNARFEISRIGHQTTFRISYMEHVLYFAIQFTLLIVVK